MVGLLVLIGLTAGPAWGCRWVTRSYPGVGERWGVPVAGVDTTDAWTLPVSAPSLCDYNSECQPSLTADGKTLYYSIGRVNGPTPDGLFYGSESENWNVYTARWNEAESRWDSIANVGPVVNPARDPCVTPGGDTLYVSKSGDIHVAYRNPTSGEWDFIEKIGPPVSLGSSAEAFPHLARHDGGLYFTSNRTPSEPWGGDYDIYVARRDPLTGEWDTVEMLGPGVNTSGTEGSPSLSPDGRRLRFTDFPGFRDGFSYGEHDLYVSGWDSAAGDWGTAQLVPPPVNCDKSICSCFETLDGKLYVGSEVWEGVRGEEDLMVSTWVPAGASERPGQGLAGTGPRSEWEMLGDLPGARHVYRIVETPAGVLYAATLAEPLDQPRAVVYRSTDGGESWAPTAPLLDAMAALSLLAVGDTLYAGTYPNGDVFRSVDGGASWVTTAELPGVTGVRTLLRTHDGAIMVGTSPDSAKWFRVFRSTDAGANWVRLGDLPSATGSVNCLFETEDDVLLAGGRHISEERHALMWVSTDGGATWTTHQLPVEHDKLTIGEIVFFARTSDGMLWTGGWAHAPQGIVCRSTDDGLTWEWMPTLYRGSPDSLVSVPRFFDLVEAPDGSYILGAQPAPDSLCWRSTDAGDTWRTMGPLTGAWEALCLLRTSDGAVLAGTTPNGDVYRWNPTSAEDEPLCPKLGLRISGSTRDLRSITYSLPEPCNVLLRIHNAVGRAVATPVDDFVAAGTHTVRWQLRGPAGEDLPNGVYFISLQTDQGSISARTVIAR
jgi:photosystem II stability/assembly factor-like uncharacterized protein